MILRSRIVLPVSAPPIENGAVAVIDDRLGEVGPWRTIASRYAGHLVEDLGEVVLLPGLINAHCHLDYSNMAGQIPAPKYFSDWIKGILAFKAHMGYSEFAASWITGAQMLLRSGTTTVADIEAVPELIPEVWEATPLKVCSLFEMTGVRSRQSPEEILNQTLRKMDRLPAGLKQSGLSPHALYSTSPELMRLAARESRRRKCLMASHVAESQEEFDMYVQAKGKLYDWLKTQRDMQDCGSQSPVQRLATLGVLGTNFLAIHVNFLDRKDAALLAASGSSVVHCPRSHAYFQRSPFPLDDLLRAEVNVCLGTDSLASMKKEKGRLPELNMFLEMRALAAAKPVLSPLNILRMATLNGAKALGLAGKAGELTPGAYADLTAVPYAGPIVRSSQFLVFEACLPSFVMINGLKQSLRPS